MKQRYRERIVEVEAVQLTDQDVQLHLFNGERLPDGVRVTSADYHKENRTISRVRLHVGGVRADIGDWIVTDKAGVYHVVKPEDFARIYEPVEVYP